MTGFHPSTTLLIIIAVVAAVAIVAILGWRAPDRSPGADTQRQRERIED